jgi:uncharacterized protein
MNLESAHRNRLLALARQSVESGLHAMRWVPMPALDLPTALTEPRGSFVTLRIAKQLRGCCGNLSANRSLAEDIWRNAWASAFADPRFPPLEAEEWGEAEVHISVLSPLEPLAIDGEAELLELLRPRIDGLVLERDAARVTFLPEVWNQLPDPVEFLQHLKQKAGWPATSWSPYIKAWRYTTDSFGERELEALQTSAA